jgi:hypothetical protein
LFFRFFTLVIRWLGSLFVCLLCVFGFVPSFRGGSPLFLLFWFSVFWVPFPVCGVFVGVWLPPGWASSWVPCWFLPCVGVRRSFLWGFPMLSFSSLPSFASVGPVSSVPAPAPAPVVPAAPVSLAPLSSVSWGGVVRLARLGWEPSSSSVLVWVVGSSVPLVCRVRSSPRLGVSCLVSELRALVRSGAECRLGVRGSWSGGKWFCAVSPA